MGMLNTVYGLRVGALIAPTSAIIFTLRRERSNLALALAPATPCPQGTTQ